MSPWRLEPVHFRFKGIQRHAIDPLSGHRVPLFNPRRFPARLVHERTASGYVALNEDAVGVTARHLEHVGCAEEPRCPAGTRLRTAPILPLGHQLPRVLVGCHHRHHHPG